MIEPTDGRVMATRDRIWLKAEWPTKNGRAGAVLLTGATGFLGTQVARRLLAETGWTIYALVRAEDREAAEQRLARSWWQWPELRGALGDRVQALPGDVAQSHLGLDAEQYRELTTRLTHIIHTAADLRLNGPIEELRAINLAGTEHVLELARAVHAAGGLARLAHVSTAYVAGGRSGPVPEDALTDRYGFSSAYEFSKYEAELRVQAAKAELPISVFRPGMIVGDSRTGEIRAFNTVYFPLRLYVEGKLPLVPASGRLPVNLVPVDYVAEAIVRLIREPQAVGLNFHLTAPHASLPSAGEWLEFVREWARKELGVRLARPLFVPLPLPRGRYDPARPPAREESTFGALRTLLPYCNENREFRRDNVDRLLGPYPLEWRSFMANILSYAVSAGFMHRSERTVHEQVLYRLASKSRPVTCHDISGGQVVTRHGGELRRDMLAATAALRALGVRPGERVALAGNNSTRYLTLDVAIDMAGAVSVPLYYTSTPADIDHILAASGARLLFVGTPQLLARVGEITARVPVISFCAGSRPADLASAVTAWDEFLALGEAEASAGGGAHSASPAGFGDLATLRYTSGTTGQPKGVMFRQADLLWMGQTLASLLPWRARIRRARYLSVLPLSHVVEGILAAYAPYYLPAPVDIYFLDDFRQLQQALPRVQPTFFFSVPRVFEKAWQGLEASRAGRFYLARPLGLLRDVLRPLVRRSLLGKLGLRHAAQLLVGSAPVGEQLLERFRELGVEIHNAYGLSEAPLVTMNRLGANQIGTAGTPLPSTAVRIAADGEVLVRGPQVTAGYFEQQTASPLQNGWLHTGDLGHLTKDGYLVLQGRKKELIKTAYGKYVQPAKVESLLRDIPGVAEAMVVGEARPHCVALLWMAATNYKPAAPEAIASAVRAANRQLSHPEQVKRWAILTNDLSIERGDLTASLKLKRHAVMQRFGNVIDSLYDGSPHAWPAGMAPESRQESLLWVGGAARN